MHFKSLLIASILFVAKSGVPFAAFADDAPLVPSSALLTGKYKTEGSSISGLLIKKWADSYLMKGRMHYSRVAASPLRSLSREPVIRAS
jgi:hypothetical protein